MGLLDNTPTGRLILQIMLSFTEFEREMIKERTAAGKAIARQKLRRRNSTMDKAEEAR